MFDHTQTLFETTSFEDLAHLTVKLATQVIDVRSILKDTRNFLEEIDPIVGESNN